MIRDDRLLLRLRDFLIYEKSASASQDLEPFSSVHSPDTPCMDPT